MKLFSIIKKYFFKENVKYNITEVVDIYIQYDDILNLNCSNIKDNFNRDLEVVDFKCKLKIVLDKLSKDFHIINTKDKIEVDADFFLRNDFLFYNDKLAMNYQECIITKDKKSNYVDFDTWVKYVCKNKKEDILFCNDYDGQGITFYINKNTPRYKFLSKILFEFFFKNGIFYNESHVFVSNKI